MKSRAGPVLLVALMSVGLMAVVSGCGGSRFSGGSTQSQSTATTTAKQASEAAASLTINSTCAEWTSAGTAEQKSFISQVIIPEVRFEKNLIWSDVVNTCEEASSEGAAIRRSLGNTVK